MTSHLLYITIGPIQDFILQARRTRDLWYGSHLLSELSRSTARTLVTRGSKLVFPMLTDADLKGELAACPAPFRPVGHPNAGKPPLAIANIIIAEVDGTSDTVRAVAAAARDEMQAYLAGDQLAGRIWNDENCADLIAPGTKAIWDEQIASLVEFTAAWTEMKTGAEYGEARRRITKEVAGRKNLRDFEPWVELRGSVPKSSLDAAREAVLKRPEARPKRLVRKYRLGEAEQLDAVGLLKRTGGETKESVARHHLQFVPLPNVALACWMKEAEGVAPEEFGRVRDYCREWSKKNIHGEQPERVERSNIGWVDRFRYDASIFMRNRWWPMAQEQGLRLPVGFDGLSKHDQDLKILGWREDVIKWGTDLVGPLLSKMHDPSPYVACLVADGDGMGKAIDGLKTARENRKFSADLAAFALEARDIVENKCLGSLVFAGGDDVLAFVPVHTAVKCADLLREDFEKRLAAYATLDSTKNCGSKPTLSVGIGVGHVLEAMGDLLQLGREAEKLAKGAEFKSRNEDRNALAIIVDKRSGGQRSWRARWPDAPGKRLERDAKFISDRKLSKRKIYEIAAILRRLPEPSASSPPLGAPRSLDFNPVLIGEVERILKRAGEAPLAPCDVSLGIDKDDDYKANHRIVAGWIDRMLIADAIADAAPRRRDA